MLECASVLAQWSELMTSGRDGWSEDRIVYMWAEWKGWAGASFLSLGSLARILDFLLSVAGSLGRSQAGQLFVATVKVLVSEWARENGVKMAPGYGPECTVVLEFSQKRLGRSQVESGC